MGFKLFKSSEERMKEAMFGMTLPIGRDMKLLLASNGDYYMSDYNTTVMYERPLQELLFLKEKLKNMRVGLAVCEDAGVFYADPIQVVRFRPALQQILDKGTVDSSLVFIVLIKNFWTSKIPISKVRVFMEGFEVETFVDGERVRKVFVQKPPRSFENE